MADNRNNKNQDANQNKGQVSQKPQRPGEQENQGNRQQSSNKDLDKNAGNENRQIQKDLDTDETDEGQDLDEQGEVTQRNPRMGQGESQR